MKNLYWCSTIILLNIFSVYTMEIEPPCPITGEHTARSNLPINGPQLLATIYNHTPNPVYMRSSDITISSAYETIPPRMPECIDCSKLKPLTYNAEKNCYEAHYLLSNNPTFTKQTYGSLLRFSVWITYLASHKYNAQFFLYEANSHYFKVVDSHEVLVNGQNLPCTTKISINVKKSLDSSYFTKPLFE